MKNPLPTLGRLIFKSTSVAGALVITGFMTWYQPHLINAGFDTNLELIKVGVRALPDWWRDVAEAGLRMINAERTFFFMEIVVCVKFVLLGLGMLFRRHVAKPAANKPSPVRRAA